MIPPQASEKEIGSDCVLIKSILHKFTFKIDK